MAKKVKAVVRLQIQAGKANPPAPPNQPGARATWRKYYGVL